MRRKLRKTVMMLGASERHTPFIRKMKESGLDVVAIDYDSEAPGFLYCKEYDTISISGEEEKALKFAMENNIDAAISLPCIGLHTLSYINSMLGLKGYTMVYNKLMFNKRAVKTMVEASLPNINVPKDYADGDDDFPYLKKPFNSTGSTGICLVNCKEDLREFPVGSLVEQYVNGDLLSVDLLMQNGKMVYFFIHDRELLHGDSFVDSLIFSPSKYYKGNMIYEIAQAAESIADMVGIKDGNANVQFIICNNEPYFIEINPRVSGPYGIECHTLATDRDWFMDNVDVLLGNTVDKYNFPQITPNACITIAAQEEGILDYIVLPDKDKYNIVREWWWKKPGDSISPLKAVKDCIGFYFIMGRNKAEVYEDARKILDTIKIVTK